MYLVSFQQQFLKKVEEDKETWWFLPRVKDPNLSDLLNIGLPGLTISEKPWGMQMKLLIIQGLESLNTEVKKIDAVPPDAAWDDCSTSIAESIEPRSEASEEPAGSETTGSQSYPSLGSLVQLRGFFGLLKKGPGIPSQVLLKKGKRSGDDMVPPLESTLNAELSCFKSSWKNFSLSELEEATDNFSDENLIGKGGYAEVYKGQLKTGMYVVVKQLMKGSPEEMTIDFLSELGIIVHVDHPNIAKTIGYGVEGGMHLVLQLSPHGSLASILYGPREKLNWSVRFKIAVGTAEGLGYLHEGCQRRIIHKDIKAANILLSEHFDAQISDVGLSKWFPDQWTHHTVSKVEGTFGYLSPELFMHGIVDEKTDVYAFGVLLLELITGRQAVDSSHRSLLIWAKPLIAENKIKELIDPTLGDDYDLDELKRCIATASICIDQSAIDRPQMSQALAILKGDVCCLEMLKERSAHRRIYSEEIFDAEEYNLTKCSNDQNSQINKV
ncbi:receptor-like cytosolic serine/threonine-protein kinase RBK2 [Hibiscus syriacus]|uniref:receptor-like cytosolic serine/threonine-protein kinase RBK2 n=1 Tax=Hibiscus syriacus TaxID=106335 RepID=UPI0019219531|nr:receptor-like cytosolic serine/threonine-protein kinase RBK2 [Hibiscus syriacus]